MSEITSFSQLDLDKSYTYQDYLTWKFQDRLELFKGRIFKMSPAPKRSHQDISLFLTGTLFNYLKGKTCKLYEAPFDVRLPITNKKGQTNTVVQPDLCVICDLSKLDEAGCNGAPDLVIEILSPGNTKKELSHKFDLYEESGVKEYWTVHIQDRNIIKYVLNKEGHFRSGRPYVEGDMITTDILPELEIQITDVFDY